MFRKYFLVIIALAVLDARIIITEQEVKEPPKSEENHYALLSKFALEPENIEQPLPLELEDVEQDSKEQSLKTEQKKVEPLILSKRSKQSVVYSLLAHNGRLKHTTDVIAPEMWQEWNIINSPLSGPDLLHAIDNTQTIFGNVMLARLLSEPKVNVELIEKRRNFIKLLIEDKELFKHIENALEVIKEKEDIFLNLWYLQRGYFLQTKNSWIGQDEQKNNFADKIAMFLNHPEIINCGRISLYSTFGAIFTCLGAFGPAGATRVTIDMIRSGAIIYRPLLSLTSLSITWLIAKLIIVYSVALEYIVFKALNEDAWNSYKDMQSVSVFFQMAKEIADKLAQKGQIPGYSLYRNLRKSVYQAEAFSLQFKRLQELLEPNFYKQEVKWYTLFGKVFSAYGVINKVKHNFAQMFEAIGQLDAYMSVARMIKKHNKTDHKYSFVEFVQETHPVIDLVQNWNPLLGMKSVFNDIQFGQAYHSTNVLFTGPHGGGKSTTMKTIAYSTILSQVFGIAPAARATMTITDKLFLYANIRENIAQEQSLLMAEMSRINDIVKGITSLKPDQHSIVLIDEPFKGTMNTEGFSRLSQLIGKIAPINNNLFVIATHLKKAAGLEDEMPEYITNYHFGLKELPNGSFKREFKLIKGKNEWWFTDKEKRKRYIDWLISL